jgi:hypothetical protein
MSHTFEMEIYRDLVKKGVEAESPGQEKVKEKGV